MVSLRQLRATSIVRTLYKAGSRFMYTGVIPDWFWVFKSFKRIHYLDTKELDVKELKQLDFVLSICTKIVQKWQIIRILYKI